MNEQKIKVGFYTISKIKTKVKTIYRVDSGKTILLRKLRKRILNPNRDIKDFSTLIQARNYALLKLSQYQKKKDKVISKIPKSLYLILIKEESTNTTFVKVGITSKRFILRRFSKAYGYEGYVVETILRRIDSPNAEAIEKKIKDQLNKKRSVKKYRPILESFSGYSECFNQTCLDDIIKVFDDLTKNES
jgi:hypothetical protein